MPTKVGLTAVRRTFCGACPKLERQRLNHRGHWRFTEERDEGWPTGLPLRKCDDNFAARAWRADPSRIARILKRVGKGKALMVTPMYKVFERFVMM